MVALAGQSWAPAHSYKHRGGTHEDAIEQWWQVSAQPLVARCMRKYDWKLSLAERCLKGYRQFMELKTVMNDWKDKQLTPPISVSMMWEEHILDNLNYSNDCVLLFGHTIGHNPDASLDERAWLERIKTTKIAFQARFANDMDYEVWDWGDIELGMNEASAMDVDLPSQVSPPSTPTGRLPVAQPDRAINSSPVSRSHLPRPNPRHMTNTLSDDTEDEPVPSSRYSPRGLPSTRATSPARRAVSPVRARTHALASRATSLSPKPSTPTGNDPITIYLKDKDSGDQTYFSLRYRIPFRVMFAVYAERKHIDQEQLHFTYNGQALTGFETPYSIGLEEGEHIDVQANERR
jgi:hypothetical protein